MVPNTWQDELLHLIAEISGEDAVCDQALQQVDLFEEGILDSIAAVELLVGIEERFGVSIAPTELDRSEMNTVEKIIARVGERRA